MKCCETTPECVDILHLPIIQNIYTNSSDSQWFNIHAQMQCYCKNTPKLKNELSVCGHVHC